MGADDRKKLSVIIPSFNEEKNIEECLKSVSWADEIFLVDSFSSDRTIEIARAYTDRIVQHEFINDSVQKNWAIPQASHDWILIVDCDERVPPELKNEILNLLRGGYLKDGYWIRRRNYLMGRHIRYSGWGKDSVLRLFKKEMGRYEEKSVHGEIMLQNTGILTSPFEHYTLSSMNEWVNKINQYSSYKSKDKFNAGMRFPVLHMILRPPVRFLKDLVFRKGILDGWRGFLIASMSAFAELVMSAKVVQLTYEEKKRQA